MKQGRPPIATFGVHHKEIDFLATKATNIGIYTVDSLNNGICYFFENNEVVIATSGGFVKMNIETAETMADELKEIIQDVKKDAREGRTPMNAKAISKMLKIQQGG